MLALNHLALRVAFTAVRRAKGPWVEANTAFTATDYRTVDSANGVTLRECGKGKAVFVFPGMEGSGESCLHLAEPVINQARAGGTPYRLVLVDYAREEHDTLSDLIGTINQLR